MVLFQMQMPPFFLTFDVGRHVWTTLILGSSMRRVEGQSTLPGYIFLNICIIFFYIHAAWMWEYNTLENKMRVVEVIWMIIKMTVPEHNNMQNLMMKLISMMVSHSNRLGHVQSLASPPSKWVCFQPRIVSHHEC